MLGIGTIAVLIILLARPWSPALTSFTEKRLTEELGQPVSLGRVRLGLFPPEIEATGVRVHSPKPGAPPLFEASRLTLRPSPLTVFSSRPVLSRVHLERPRLFIAAYTDGTSNLPAPPDRSGPPRQIRIRRFVVEGGEIVVDHARIPLEMDLPDLQTELVARRGRGVAGSVSFAPGRLKFGEATPLPFGLSADIEWLGRRVGLSNGRARAKRTDLAVAGEIFLKGGVRGVLNLDGAVDVGELDRHVFRTGLRLEGRGSWVGRTSIDGSTIRFEGHLDARDGAFDSVAISRCVMDVDWDGSDVRLRNVSAATLGGSGLLDADVPTGSGGTVHLQGSVKDVDTEGLFAYVLGIGSAGVGATATGRLEVSWPTGAPRLISGRVGLDLRPTADGRTPLGGRLDWVSKRGDQTIERAELSTPATQARLSGHIDANDRISLDFSGSTTDLQASDDLGARLLRALGSKGAAPVGLSGRATFEGKLLGSLDHPVYAGRFTGPQVSYLGVDWGAVEWDGELDENELRSRSLVARRGASTLCLSGRSETGALGARDAIDLRVATTAWPAEDFVKAFAWTTDYKGELSASIDLKGRRSAPAGGGRLKAASGLFRGVRYADLDADVIFRGDVTDVRSAQATVNGGRVRLKGTASDGGVYDGTFELTGVEIEGLLPAAEGRPALAGPISGQGRLRGTLDRPLVETRLTSPGLFWGKEGLGDLEATITGAGDGVLRVAATSRSPRFDASLSGTVRAEWPSAGEMSLQIRQTDLDPYLRTIAPGLPQALRLVAGGSASIRGPFRTPRALVVSVDVPRLDAIMPEYQMRSAGAVSLRYAADRLEIARARLTGDGSDVEISGSIGAGATRDLAVSARGRSDLRVVSIFTERLRGRGAAFLQLDVTGTTDKPLLDGTLRIDGGGIRVRGFPQGIEDVKGTIRFTENVAVLESVSGTAGGGPASLEGQASYAAGRLSAFDIRAKAQDVALNYPEGLRSRVGADLRFFGDPSRQWITGVLDVKDAVLTRRYDVASQLIGPAAPIAGDTSLYSNLRYDVRIRAPGTLRIDNNLGTLSARAELSLQGTYDRPVLVGRSEIEQGRIYFQGQSYTIRHGTLDFANPQRIDPFFDIEGEARVRSYTVTLRLNGTLDRVTPTLTSDPPLDTLAVLSLLAGAPESVVTDSAFLSSTERVQQNLAVAGAAALVSRAAPLTRDVQQGAERVAERIGLSRFSIDPSLARGSNTNPTARLTVGKRLSRDVDFYYSMDLKNSQEQLYSLEYTVSRRLSILFTKADPQGAGVDLRLKNTR